MNQTTTYNAVITVIGKDRVGIIHKVTGILADANVNVSDISQTILQDVFTMIMLVDLSGLSIPQDELRKSLTALGDELWLEIRMQHKAVFNAMHRI